MALYEAKGKFYNIDGLKLVRVTSVLDVINKPQLVPWAARTAAEIALAEPSASIDRIISGVFQRREDAADIGTKIHEIIERKNNNENVNLNLIPEYLQGRIHAFLSFCETINPKTILSEQVCYSKKHGYAGTTDWIARLPNGEVWLFDFKTGGIYAEAGLQMSAYKNAIHEMIESNIIEADWKIAKTAVIQLCNDGTFNLRIFDFPFEIFLNVLEVFKWHNENK